MAACHKCGRMKIKKRPDGKRKCKRCGFLPGDNNLDRSGERFVNNLRQLLTNNGELYVE